MDYIKRGFVYCHFVADIGNPDYKKKKRKNECEMLSTTAIQKYTVYSPHTFNNANVSRRMHHLTVGQKLQSRQKC